MRLAPPSECAAITTGRRRPRERNSVSIASIADSTADAAFDLSTIGFKRAPSAQEMYFSIDPTSRPRSAAKLAVDHKPDGTLSSVCSVAVA